MQSDPHSCQDPRDLRRKHGLDESACAEVAETVRRLIVRYQGGG